MSLYMYVIILVAGKSIRFHGQKQFLGFHGKNVGTSVWFCLIYNTEISDWCVGIDIMGHTRSESVKIGLQWIYDKGNCKRLVNLEAARNIDTK